MRRVIPVLTVILLALPTAAVAQSTVDLLITNARIIVGTGTVLDSGSVVVTDGRITSVTAGVTDTDAETRIDGSGLRRRLESGDLKGPRLLVAGPVFTASDGHPAVTVCRNNPWCRALVAVEVDSRETAREYVRALAAAGVDAIKAVYDDRAGVRIADDVLAAIGEEADRHDIPLIVHSTNMSVVDLGADRLVHIPVFLEEDGRAAGETLSDRRISVATTVGVVAPVVDESGVTRTPYGGEYREASLNRALALVRQLWDGGATVAFGTDTPLGASEALRLETDALSKVLTPDEILMSLTINAARHLDLSEEIGTLESGKVADILIIDGDPLSDIADLANVVLVVQQGAVVIDNR